MNTHSPTLVILAAGMGSRYGGLKQMDPMGPSGETVLDYSVYDAIRAKFKKIVFVIREDFADDFEHKVISKFKDKIETHIVFQKLEDLPDGYCVPLERVKPWGTAHAIWAARDAIKDPFAIINADDYYGQDGLLQVANALRATSSEKQDELYTIIGYKLKNTLSDYGSVNRGICSYQDNYLSSVEEYTEIKKNAEGLCLGKSTQGVATSLSLDSLVSMNLWGFPTSIIGHIETFFTTFLQESGHELKSECYLPSVVDFLIKTQQAKCQVVASESEWFGVTYPQDKEHVVKNINRLVKDTVYPNRLW